MASPKPTPTTQTLDRASLAFFRGMQESFSIGGLVLRIRRMESEREGRRRLKLENAEWQGASIEHFGLGSSPSVREVLRKMSSRSRTELFGKLRTACERDAPFDLTVCIDGELTRGAERRWLRLGATVIEGASEWLELCIVFTDVTEEVEQSRQLETESCRNEQIARMAHIGIWTVDLADNELYWSDEVFRIHDMVPGPTPRLDEAIAFYPDEARTLMEESLARLLATGERYNVTLPMVTAKGRDIWVEALGDLEVDAHGQPTKLVGVFREVTDEHLAQEALEASQRQLEVTLEGTRDGLWEWNLMTNQVKFSERWKELIGHSGDEILDDIEEWASRVPNDDRDAALVQLNAFISGETQFYRTEFRMRHKDGSWRWILARGTALERDENGGVTRVVGTHTDITEQVELQQDTEDAKRMAEDAARAKAEFLATMSHEIRTPMNGILGLSQVLLDTPLVPEQREHLNSIYHTGTALLSILNDILDLSKFDAGKLQLESVPTDPVRCANDVVQLLSQEAARRENLKLSLDVGPGVPRAVLGDPGRLRQIIMNLVGNAIKFTEEGSVEVRINVLPGFDGKKDLLISVLDTGIGISQNDARKLFEAFTQADSSTTRKFGGTGLGLSIVKRLTGLMGGTLGCKQGRQRGSVFWVEIPVETIDASVLEEADAAAARDQERTFEGLRVLVVEDNKVNQVVARKLLQKLGCKVAMSENGAQALERTQVEEFAAVFMDCQMPVMDGYTATAKIREREHASSSSRLRIIAMTANASEGDRERCLEAGMDDYVSKPVLVSDLHAALTRVLDCERAMRTAS